MRKRDAVAHIVEHEHDKSIEYSVDPTAFSGTFIRRKGIL